MILSATIKMKHLLFVVSLLSIMASMNFGLELTTVCEWKYIDYKWNSEQEKEAIDSGDYNASLCILFDVEKAPGRLILFERLNSDSGTFI